MPREVPEELAKMMRRSGVRRIRWGADDLVDELELFDTIPAPPPDDFMTPAEIAAIIDPPPEQKPAGICQAIGCNADNGHPFAPEYCRAHALSAAGVD
jgi:hypothetical protein